MLPVASTENPRAGSLSVSKAAEKAWLLASALRLPPFAREGPTAPSGAACSPQPVFVHTGRNCCPSTAAQGRRRSRWDRRGAALLSLADPVSLRPALASGSAAKAQPRAAQGTATIYLAGDGPLARMPDIEEIVGEPEPALEPEPEPKPEASPQQQVAAETEPDAPPAVPPLPAEIAEVCGTPSRCFPVVRPSVM
jgi:outer membrane biosynthesis protein TonB